MPPKHKPSLSRRKRKKARRARAIDHALAGLGEAPGTASYQGSAPEAPLRLACFDYGLTHVVETDLSGHEAPSKLLDTPPPADTAVRWLDLQGLHDTEAVRTISKDFGVHPLALEDALNADSRPKAEDYGEALFVIAKMLHAVDRTPVDHGIYVPAFEAEQVALLLTAKGVLTLQERPGDAFEPVRRRIRQGAGRVRRRGADYLLHGLLDAVVDGYFAILSPIEDALLDLEDRGEHLELDELARSIDRLRRELTQLRRLVWPLREAATELIRSEGGLIQPTTVPYLRDLHDHITQVLDLIDHQRERLNSLLDLHLALASHRMNDVMRGLTIVATVFMPITFLAGIYGMNFTHMPELDWPYAYPSLIAVMCATTAGLLAYLRRQGWW